MSCAKNTVWKILCIALALVIAAMSLTIAATAGRPEEPPPGEQTQQEVAGEGQPYTPEDPDEETYEEEYPPEEEEPYEPEEDIAEEPAEDEPYEEQPTQRARDIPLPVIIALALPLVALAVFLIKKK